ncbi:MAG: glycerophosphodiester phosphodiesterase [Longispora sp.]|nr:glycerophosphodiester phosphodiesterase [Longispora sp. (in: high G+C Gram-positive bacteria)]
MPSTRPTCSNKHQQGRDLARKGACHTDVVHPYFSDETTPIAFAHRGGSPTGAENTFAAFEQAVSLGYQYMETDVHTSSDGVAVVFHDHDTARMTGEPGSISRRTWAEIQKLRVKGEPIPRLDDLLAAWPDVHWNIDLKTNASVAPTIKAIQRAGATNRVLLASFEGARLLRVRKVFPQFATSVTRGEIAALRLFGRKPAGGLAAQVPIRYGRLTVLTPRFIESAHAAGIQVHVWTIDDPTVVRELLDMGVNGIMTDRAEVVRGVYQERGLWKK